MDHRFQKFELDGKEYGKIKILRSKPTQSFLGVLSELEGTDYFSLINLVDGDNISLAIYGHPYPLLNQLVIKPESIPSRVAEIRRTCKQKLEKTCPAATHKCVLTRGKVVPFCFEFSEEPGALMTYLIQQWMDGYYLVAVKQEGFILPRS